MRLSRAASIFGLLALGCSSGRERPSPSSLVSTAPTATPDPPGGDGGISIDAPDVACGEFCGETFLREVKNPPNLYFVVDRSGSMGEPVSERSRSKFQAARGVIADVLMRIGHRVRYGGAVFPSHEAPQECRPGSEFFEPTRGSPPNCEGGTDPKLADFSRRLGSFSTEGGTPVSLTLDALRPKLEQLAGNTAVVLVTDGAPNCNLEAECDVDECGLNLEGARIGELVCDDDTNCCDPEIGGFGVNGYCVDGDGSEEAVLALADSGIATYVIGLPGAEPYADVLSRLAVAGGRPQEEVRRPPVYQGGGLPTVAGNAPATATLFNHRTTACSVALTRSGNHGSRAAKEWVTLTVTYWPWSVQLTASRADP